MPKPLADYMATVLNETAHEGLRFACIADADKRARGIVKALHFNYKHTARHESEREFERKIEAFNAQFYMYNQITYEGISKSAAARQAAKKYPGAVTSISDNNSAENDGRIKAYIILYKRGNIDFALMIKEYEKRLDEID